MEWRRRFEFNLDLICQRWGPISLLANFPNFPILEFIRCIRRKIPARSIDLFRSNLHRQFFDHGEFKDSYLFCWILHVKADSNRFNITFIIILSFVTCWSFPTVFAVYNNNKVSTHTYILYMLRGSYLNFRVELPRELFHIFQTELGISPKVARSSSSCRLARDIKKTL